MPHNKVAQWSYPFITSITLCMDDPSPNLSNGEISPFFIHPDTAWAGKSGPSIPSLVHQCLELGLELSL